MIVEEEEDFVGPFIFTDKRDSCVRTRDLFLLFQNAFSLRSADIPPPSPPQSFIVNF